MATWSTGISLRGQTGATGPASIVTVTAPPGPGVGVVGGYAVQNNNGVVLLYGPKQATGWPGDTNPTYVQLTGQTGQTGAAGTNGRTILQTTGKPADATGNDGDVAIDFANAFLWGPRTGGTWPTQPINLVGPSGPPGPTGPAATFPNDVSANSLSVAPVSGSAKASAITQKSSGGATLFASDASGNVQAAGTLQIAGATTLAAASCTSMANSGNGTIGGTLSVTGASTLAGASCTTLSASGNTTVGGTLGVTGASTLAGASCTSLSASGNATVGGTLGVTGATTAAAITSSATVTAKNLTLTSGGGGSLTFADGTSMSTAATGTGGGSSSTARTAFDMGGYQYSPLSAGTYAPTKKTNTTAGTNNNSSNNDISIRMPWAGSIVGFSLQQNISSVGNNSIAYIKNGTQLTPVTNVGSGAGNFYGTHATTAFPFAAGDRIQMSTTISTSGNTDIFACIYVQWS